MAWIVYAFHVGVIGSDFMIKIGCTTKGTHERGQQLSGKNGDEIFDLPLALETDASNNVDDFGNGCSGLEQEILSVFNESGLSDSQYWEGRSGYTEVYRLNRADIRALQSKVDLGLMSLPAVSFIDQLILSLTQKINDCIPDHGIPFSVLEKDEEDTVLPQEEQEIDDWLEPYHPPGTGMIESSSSQEDDPDSD